MKHLTLLLVLSLSSNAFAWGKRGHQVVAETAALVVSSDQNNAWMRAHSFDFAYYANVPDLVWKRPSTYPQEKPQHFMDLDVFQRHLSARKDVEKPFALSRKDFDAKFPEIKGDDGRAYWRIREMAAKLEKVTEQIRGLKDDQVKERQALQEKWLMLAGPMAHYVGDLSMPLHVSENYDGQLTGQKGIHHYFEEDMVDQLYPELAAKVASEARKLWPAFTKKNAGKTVLDLLEQQTKNSLADVRPLLTLDKGHKREPTLKEAKRYEAMIVRRMVDASLTLGEIYRRNLGWKFDDDKFYFFSGEPAFLPPGEE